MVRLDEIRAGADAARAPCAAYWLLVFSDLMIYLFPVQQLNLEPGYSQPRPVVYFIHDEDWSVPAAVEETPFTPRRAYAPPENHRSAHRQWALASAPDLLIADFEARGPPLTS